MNSQLSIFDVIYPKFKIDKPIRLIELFAGYGSQALALKYLNIPFEHWKICEWAIKSIQAYKDIHFIDDTDYSKTLNKEQLQEFLFNKGISSNYNEPMNREQINRLNESNLRTIYNNIVATHNMVNIQQVKGEDLEIVDTDKYCYIMCYSFPCQDLSLAGKGKGMSDTSTRSGMLWEVERILTECENKPQVLLMENVPQVHGEGNTEDFNKWQLRLEELGYKNYWEDLIATDYGIPQTRNRCFMVSILGDYSYSFPPKQELKLKLKDLLEDAVDEKYYLSDKMINFFIHNQEKQKENGNGFRFNVSDGNVIAKTITTNAGSRMDDNFIINKGLKETLEQNEIKDTCYIDTYNKKIDKEKSGTITTGVNFRNNTFLAIKNATKNNISPTLDTRCDCLGVVTLGNYSPSNHNASRIVDQNYSAPTVMENHGTLTATQTSDLRIRKLTPKECFRLMGVKDEDYEKCAKNQSNASLYHLAGDSIVVNVLMAIFKEML